MTIRSADQLSPADSTYPY